MKSKVFYKSKTVLLINIVDGEGKPIFRICNYPIIITYSLLNDEEKSNMIKLPLGGWLVLL